MTNPEITLIAAVADDGAIGRNNELPWHVPEDLQRFKQYTHKGVVIMGHNTYKSIPARFRPLSNRFNIVLTRAPEQTSALYDPNPNVIFVDMPTLEAMLASPELEKKRIFVIGGSSVYDAFMMRAQHIRLTRICKTFPGCDAYFPTLPNRFAHTFSTERTYCTKEGCDFYIEYYIAVSSPIQKK